MQPEGSATVLHEETVYQVPGLGFLRRHQVLLLLLLSPGIPEYLSPSSPLYAVLTDPPQFFLQLALNLGLYGPGVLLIREAKVRWKKGWGTVLVLGVAYGILEEGIALSTMFNPKAGPVGVLGYYGHWLGVSWVWSAELVIFHSLFSISLPILIFELALPGIRGTSLLSDKKLLVAVAILLVDVSALFESTLSSGFWMGAPVFVGSLLAIGALVYVARRMPMSFFSRYETGPRRGRMAAFLVGASVFPASFFLPYIYQGIGLPPVIAVISLLSVAAVQAAWIVRNLGRPGNEWPLTALALGLVLPIALTGAIVELPLDLVLLADLALALLFRRLFRYYAPSPAAASEPISTLTKDF